MSAPEKFNPQLSICGYPIELESKQVKLFRLINKPENIFIKAWGGARSGKTYLEVILIILRALHYEKSNHIVCRYSKATAKKTVWRQTMLPILEYLERKKVCKINRSEQFVRFTNGSSISLGGLRPSDISNVLSSEYATILVVEANENTWGIIEDLMSRLNSMAEDIHGNVIICKFLADMNPTFHGHWSEVAWLKGINPTSMEPLDNYKNYANLHFIPSDNKKHLSASYWSILNSLSPAKRKRYLLGEYGMYENLVYSMFKNEYIIDDIIPDPSWRKIRAIDFGFTKGHSFVCLWMCVDNNENVIVYREYVQERTTVRLNAVKIKELSRIDFMSDVKRLKADGESDEVIDGFISDMYEGTVADHDAEDRATLEENGISTVMAWKKSRETSIEHVIDFTERGKRLVCRSCVQTLFELGSWQWKISERVQTKDRDAEKKNDNCMDAERYGYSELFPIGGGGSVKETNGI